MSPLILPRAGILSFMGDEAREQLTSYGSLISTAPGQVLIREGDVNTYLYIVLGGTFNISTSAPGHEVELDAVGINDCLGEVAIFHPDKACATVTSTQAGQLWAIDAEQLQQFLLDWPNYGCAAILGINIILSRRLKHANSLIRFHQIVPGFLSVRSKNRTGKVKMK